MAAAISEALSVDCTGELNAEQWLMCLDLSPVQDAVEAVVVVGIGIALLFAGLGIARRVIRAFRDI